MWNGLIVFLAVIAISTMIGAISSWLRKQQQAEIDRRAAQTRSGPPRTKPDGALEKFAEEVDRLRQKRTDDVARAKSPKAVITSKAVPKVVRRPLGMEAPIVVPVVRPSTVKPAGLPKLPPAMAMLPEASVVTPMDTIHSPATIATIIEAQAPATIRRPKDVGGKDTSQAAPNLLALLANPQSLPTAIILAEILGPPQCKKR